MVIKHSINPDPIYPFPLQASRIPARFLFRAFLFCFIFFFFSRPGLLCMKSGSRPPVVYFVVCMRDVSFLNHPPPQKSIHVDRSIGEQMHDSHYPRPNSLLFLFFSRTARSSTQKIRNRSCLFCTANKQTRGNNGF